jgi:glycosyltransferase involved in cell wall biosynthesis
MPSLAIVATEWGRPLSMLTNWATSLSDRWQFDTPTQVILVAQEPKPRDLTAVEQAGDNLTVLNIQRDTPNMSWAFNVGLKYSRADYVMFTCCDLIYGPTFIQVVLERAREDRLILAHCGYVPSTLANIRGGLVTWWPLALLAAKKGEISQRLSPGACQCVSRDWAMGVHGYDERFPAQDGVDDDFMNRAGKDGFKKEWLGFNVAPILHMYHERSKTKGVGSGLFSPDAPIVANTEGWGEWQ